MFSKLAHWATNANKKRVYSFKEGCSDDRHLLGAKGVNLCDMARNGLAVPEGFVITSETCLEYINEKNTLNEHVISEYTKIIHEIERREGHHFGNHDKRTFPLLFSVRCSVAAQVPGLMNTVLNVGINDEIVEAIADVTNNEKFAYDTQRRFLQMYGSSVMGVDSNRYHEMLNDMCIKVGVKDSSELEVENLKDLVKKYKSLCEPPNDVWMQLSAVITAAFNSWTSHRAQQFRSLHGISNDMGTAVVVQSMVYGNLNNKSGCGVAFTRDPCTGAHGLCGDFLVCAEGEDVLAGERTALSVEDLHDLRNGLPEVYSQLVDATRRLEKSGRDMQDVEFTVESGRLYILESKPGKRTAQASVRMAAEMVMEGLITEREALLRVNASKLPVFQLPVVGDPADADFDFNKPLSFTTAHDRLLCRGVPGSAGCAVGVAVFSSREALRRTEAGETVILVLEQTTPADLPALRVAAGSLTMRGGVTSHAAITARALGRPCVAGLRRKNPALQLLPEEGCLRCCSLHQISEGETLTLDGINGHVFRGEVPMQPDAVQNDFYKTIMKWAETYKRMEVLATVDSAEDSKRAYAMGADGIGLCRTDSMFRDANRLSLLRTILLSPSQEKKDLAIEKLETLHCKDLIEVFRQFPTKEVCVSFLEDSLRSFFPDTEEEIMEMAGLLALDPVECVEQVRMLQPMAPVVPGSSISAAEPGLAGSRVCVIFPEITAMQTRAILRAAVQLQQEMCKDVEPAFGVTIPHVKPSMLIPMVCSEREVQIVVDLVRKEAASLFGDVTAATVHYRIGAMLDTPRGCFRAASVAAEPNLMFVLFGSDRLTRTVFGFGPGDTEMYLSTYQREHVFSSDPFVSLDQRGVGPVISGALKDCRKINTGIFSGLHGTHASDPATVQYLNSLGMDFVSCEAVRVPVAKLAAAQSHIVAVARRAREEQESLKYTMMMPRSGMMLL